MLKITDQQFFDGLVNRWFSWKTHGLNRPLFSLDKLTKSIIFYENGMDPYSEKMYKSIFPYVR
jgi:hypothetical protein